MFKMLVLMISQSKKYTRKHVQYNGKFNIPAIISIHLATKRTFIMYIEFKYIHVIDFS